MSVINLTAILAEAGQQQPGAGDFLRSPLVPMMILMFGVLYVMNRSQKKKIKEHEDLLKTVRAGDKIATTGGILGVVITVKEKSLSIRSADSKLEIRKSAVGEITERGGEASES
jgi:preprotein translocase subunit YajC